MGTKTTTPKDAALHLPQEYDEDGMLTAHTTLSSSSDPVEKCLQCKSDKVIPIIFIPGIMGTHLMNMQTKRPVWIAPNLDGILPKIKIVGLLLGSWFKSSKQRQAELDSTPGVVGVYEDGELDTAGSGLSKQEIKKRKWGSLMRTAYHPIMGTMQNQMNSVMVNKEPQGEWKERIKQEPCDWGDWEENPSLSSLGKASGLDEAADIQYEVWAAGYNWLQTNRDSAEDIINYINKTVIPSYKGKADKVIIVTHSMGGLVARAIVACHGFKNAYGVIHGAMPATGAPASYKRVRAGFEAFGEKKILGRDGADGVAVMAFAPGPLELLPTRDYNNGQPWLFARDRKTGKKTLGLPKKCPYEEIYKSGRWWGLIPERNNNLMDPANIISTKLSSDDDEGFHQSGNKLRDLFHQTIDSVKVFHGDIEGKYHTSTYVHYSAEAKSEDLLTWGNMDWSAANLDGLDIINAQLTSDNLDACISLNGLYEFEVSEPAHAGDGTVPVYSSASPRGKIGVLGAFAHGQNNGILNHHCRIGKYNCTVGYKHQNAYNDKDGRSTFATLYGLIRLSAPQT